MGNTVTVDLPAYTAEEEKLVIRNKDGVPVGIKPNSSWTFPKIVLWISITTMNTLGQTMLTLVRGGGVNTIWFVTTAVCTYAIAYRFYAFYVQRRVMRPDDSNATPTERVNNGKDSNPIHKMVLYGHHSAAIAGADPLVGPVLAARMGYLPGTLWIIFGVCIIGAIQGMLMFFFPMRRGRRSLDQMVRGEIGRVGGAVAMVVALVMLMIVLAVLTMVCANALAESPQGVFSVGCTIPIALGVGLWLRYVQPGKITRVSIAGCALLIVAIFAGKWVTNTDFGREYLHLSSTTLVWAMVIYSFLTTILPVQLLLTPRDYLSTLVKVGAIVIPAVGVVVTRLLTEMSTATEFAGNTDGPMFAETLFPFLFVAIACGALSEMHAMMSSGTTPKMVQKKSQTRIIGYGGMPTESFVAIMALAAAVSLNQGIYFGTNTSEVTIDKLAGTNITQATKDREEITSKAVHNLGMTDVHGNKVVPRWESTGDKGNEKAYTGIEALKQVTKDVGEPSIVSRIGGTPTLSVGIAHVLHRIGGGSGMMGFWCRFTIMFEALLILSAVNTVTRVARFRVSDALGNLFPKFKDPL